MSWIKVLSRIVEKHVVKKERQIISDKKGGTKWEPVPQELRDSQAITDEEIMRIAQYGMEIEKHYGVPQDIEWAVDEKGRIFILQARPETVHGGEKAVTGEERKDVMEQEILIKGIGVSPGKAFGKVKVIINVKDISRFQKGEILVTEMTTPDWVPAMKIAAAVITNLGGKTCHAAIVSRELGVPCIVGAENATKILKDGETVSVDGQRGLFLRVLLTE